MLNDALNRDADAINFLFQRKVPCNSALASHRTIVSGERDFEATPANFFDQDKNSTISTMGVINGVLAAAGLPLISMQLMSTPVEAPRPAHKRIVAFEVYRPGMSSESVK